MSSGDEAEPRGSFDLGRVYPPEEFDARWVRFLAPGRCLRHEEHFLPTEVVVYAPRLVVPMVGRSYDTGYYAKRARGDLVAFSYRCLCRTAARIGATMPSTSELDPVTLHEVWSRSGDDGHTSMEMDGWVFLAGSQFAELEASLRASDAATDWLASSPKHAPWTSGAAKAPVGRHEEPEVRPGHQVAGNVEL